MDYFFFNVIVYFFLALVTSYIFVKATNNKSFSKKEIIILLSYNSIVSILYAILKIYCNLLTTITIAYFFLSLLLSYLTKYKIEYTIYVMLISLAISFVCFLFSLLPSAILVYLILQKESDTVFLFVLAAIISSTLIYLIFRIKRFENGFSFLKNSDKPTRFGLLGIILSGSIIVIYSLLNQYREGIYQTLFLGCVVIAIGLFIWVKKNFTLFYKEMIKEDTILLLQTEVDHEKKEKEDVIEENKTLTEINHKYSHKISTLEYQVRKLYSSLGNSDVEFSTELSEITKLSENLSKEYSEEMAKRIKHDAELPKTKIPEIDKTIEYHQAECIKNNINLNVKIKYPIHYLVEKFIPVDRLEILLSDHIKDAIIAVNDSKKINSKIMLTFDVVNNIYEIRISDTGIPFEVNTLLKLGLEPVTTHKDSGGSGIGFITTFKTLKETKASIVIEEHNQEIHAYSKTIIFRFDNNEKYIIRSNRAAEISRSM